MKYCVYVHTNKINNKKYVGLTSEVNPEARWGAHGGRYKQNKHFYAAIVKYGWDNFEHEIIATELSQEEASILERELIASFNTTNPDYGYNILQGGITGTRGPLSDETKLKISLALRGKKKPDIWLQHRKEFYQTHEQPLKNHFGDQIHTSKKVRCITTGDIFGSIQEAIRWSGGCKVGECCRGIRQFSGTHPDTGEKLAWEFAEADALVTITCHPGDEKERSKPRGKLEQKVMCINTKEIFPSLKAASDWCGLKNGAHNIGRCCRNERQSAGKHPVTGEKLRWEYVD